MAEYETQPQLEALAEEFYHPEDVALPHSPPLIAMKVSLTPSPSPPPAEPLPQASPRSSPGGSPKRQKSRPSLGDAVLVSFMDGGGRLDVAQQAGQQPLASDDEEDEKPVQGIVVKVGKAGADEWSALTAPDGQRVVSSLQSAPASTDTMMVTWAKTEEERLESSHEQASLDNIIRPKIKTPASELLPVVSGPTPNLQKRKRRN